jgi:hypothetical protein
MSSRPAAVCKNLTSVRTAIANIKEEEGGVKIKWTNL